MKKTVLFLLVCLNMVSYAQNSSDSSVYTIKCTDINSIIISRNKNIDLLLKPEVLARVKQVDFSGYNHIRFDFYEKDVLLADSVASPPLPTLFIYKYKNQVIRNNKLTIETRQLVYSDQVLQEFLNALLGCMKHCRYDDCE